EIVLRILDACSDGVPVESVTSSKNRMRRDGPRQTDAWSPVVSYRARREELLSGNDNIAEMRIRSECIRYARRLLGHAAKFGHLPGADDPLLILKIQRIPQASVQRPRLRHVVVAYSHRERQGGSHFPFVLPEAGHRSIFETHRSAMENWQLTLETIRKTQQCGS